MFAQGSYGFNRDTYGKTSGPFEVKFVNRLTARDATIVEAIAAGTLKIIDMTALRFINMKICR